MRQLAAELGVSPMTPYRYFEDKDAILAAVRARAFNRHAEALEAACAATGDDPIERANAVGEAYVDFALDHPEAYKLMFDISQPDETTIRSLVAPPSARARTMTAPPARASPTPACSTAIPTSSATCTGPRCTARSCWPSPASCSRGTTPAA